jgi:large subunit ribosomal protein L25
MELVLSADPVRPIGTRPSRRLRREGKVPAVVYGLGGDPVPVAVDWRELRQCLKTEAGANALINIDIAGNRHLSIVKDIQRHPVRRDVIHVDFLRVDPTKPVTVEVPVLVTGEAKQVAAMAGIVDQQMFKVAVSARPDAIPNDITVDVSDMAIGDTVSVADLQLPAGVEAASDPESLVVQGLATRSTIQLQAEAAKDANTTGEDSDE